MKGDTDERYPKKNGVEIMAGGPPCQGFSHMNRFTDGEYSQFKNSLVASYLSYADYFRPKFFILENVRNFVAYKKNLVLKLCLRALTNMGYQVTFGTLQAGRFGVPQKRCRLVIMAAAPDHELPEFPDSMHVFAPSGKSQTVTVGDRQVIVNDRHPDSAPYRTITVWDAVSDLPLPKRDIPTNEENEKVVQMHEHTAKSFYQRMLREHVTQSRQPQKRVYDHYTKPTNKLQDERYAHIPKEFGADWRDLPNIEVRRGNRTIATKLEYNFFVKGDSLRSRWKRGVCKCQEVGQKKTKSKKTKSKKKSHSKSECQFKFQSGTKLTLIPWSLSHTGDRNNNWAGCYGRNHWANHFPTTITNPNPCGKQGQVLHPEQSRIVTVRECARSQGFPDDFQFYGRTQEKHRQIGNAVPPPLARAVGLQIRNALKFRRI